MPNAPLLHRFRHGLGAALLSILLSALLSAWAWSAAAQAPKAEIWFGPVTPDYNRKVDASFGSDFAAMFEPGAPWAEAASRTRVLKISTMFAYNAPDALLGKMIAELKRRNIALGIEGLMLSVTGGPDTCGWGIEGYTGPDVLVKIAEKIKRLGGDLRVIAMDEPLYFGHYFSGPKGCRTPLDQLARDVAARIRAVRAVFPTLAVGDIEPAGDPALKDWASLVIQWADAYRAAMGEPLAFVHADIQWHRAYQAPLRDLAGRLRQAGIRFGIIYNGEPTDAPAAWTARAEQHFLAVESDPALVPDQAIFQVWGNPKPPLNLPETRPEALTSLVNRYAAAQTQLALNQAGGAIDGRLTANGQAVANVPVTVFAVDRTAARIMQDQSVTGLVPSNAAEAVVALRLNVECNCSAAADIAIGSLRYHQEQGGPDAVRRLRQPPQGNADRFTIPAGERVSLTSSRFPVTPGQRFTLTVPMAATQASSDAGYVALIFLGADGKEVRRDRLAIRPGAQAAGTVTTRADGSLSFRPPAGLGDASGLQYQARFPGDARFRPAQGATR